MVGVCVRWGFRGREGVYYAWEMWKEDSGRGFYGAKKCCERVMIMALLGGAKGG